MSRESQERNRREAEIAQIEKNTEPDRKPWSGAGSMSGHHMLIGQPEYRATSARDRLSHAERSEFFRTEALEPLARQITSEIEGTTTNTIAFHKKMSELIAGPEPWEQLIAAGILGKEIFDGLERGDAILESKLDRQAFIRAFDSFKDSEPYAQYRKAPMALQAQVVETLINIMQTQRISPFHPSNWMILFGLCSAASYVFPPLQPQTASAPTAEDGGAIAINDRTGQPVVFEGRAYSEAMLNSLPSSEYSRVLGLHESSAQRYEREQCEERARRDQENTQIVFANGRGYSQRELNAMDSTTYARTLGLRRHDSATLIQQLLSSGGGWR